MAIIVMKLFAIHHVAVLIKVLFFIMKQYQQHEKKTRLKYRSRQMSAQRKKNQKQKQTICYLLLHIQLFQLLRQKSKRHL